MDIKPPEITWIHGTNNQEKNFDLKDALSKLPDKPGVYLMYGADHVVIYVGKAKLLKNRVRQYFQPSQSMESKIFGILSSFSYFEYIVTHTEMEALILECNLIKKHLPRYNVLLKDDKSFPYLMVTTGESYPRIEYTRVYSEGKNLFFGPYVHVNRLKDVLNLVQKIFKLRTCSLKIETLTEAAKQRGEITKNQRTCLNYHIGKCLAPCAGKISFEAYNEQVKRAIDFLENKKNTQKEVIRELEITMKTYAEALEYEAAKELRDTILGIHMFNERQLLDKQSKDNQDILGFYKKEDEVQIEVLEIRRGKMTNRTQFRLTGAKHENAFTFLSDFILQYYIDGAFIPNEIVAQENMEDKLLLESWLSDQKKRKVKITIPQRGDKVRLIRMAEKNATLTLESQWMVKQDKEDRRENILIELQNMLQLTGIPRRMEAYDISNTQGVLSVGSMVVFEDTLPVRKAYRKFNIKEVEGPNDYASMKEVISRRFKRYLENDRAFSKRPDIVFVDGGVQQVNGAQEILDGLGIIIPVVGMVKDDNHRTFGLLYQDSLFVLDKKTESYKFITRMQDEVHRFAIDFHRKRQSKQMVRSILDEIKGIGPRRRQALMTHFKYIEAVEEATLEELQNIPSMNQQSAQGVYDFFAERKKNGL